MTTTRMPLTSPMLMIFINLLLVNWHILYCQSTQQPSGAPDISSASAPTTSAGTSKPNLQLDFVYHTPEEVNGFLRKANEMYPELTHIHKIGESVKERELLVLIISRSPKERILGRPSAHYVGTVHGNEPVGGEMILHLIKYILENHETDSYVKLLVDNTNLHFLPIMNPDGYAEAVVNDKDGDVGRNNANNVDLNRDFGNPDNAVGKQLETLAVLGWMRAFPFLLSATFHGGAMVVTYPYDNVKAGTIDSSTADEEVFVHLATTYASNHPDMKEGTKHGNNVFHNGISNGAKWFRLTGGKQDCAYEEFKWFEVTVEMSDWKYPLPDQLSYFWKVNRTPMIQLLVQVHRGVKGFVNDFESKQPIQGAELKIDGLDVTFETTSNGEYWRILLPREGYTVKVAATGYLSRRVGFTVTEGRVTKLNILLKTKPKKKKGK